MRDLGDRGDVLDLERQRAGRFREHRPGVRAHQRVDPGADGRVIVARLDPEATQSLIGEGARRFVHRVRHQEMIAGLERRHQRNDDRRQARWRQHRPRRARQLAPGRRQRLGRRRAAGAVGEALGAALQRRDVGIEHGRTAKRRHIDEALREFDVAAEIHQARAAPQAGARFIGKLGHGRARALSGVVFAGCLAWFGRPWQPIDFNRPGRQ